MKRKIFKATLLVAILVSVAFTGCKNNKLTLEGQWIATDYEELFDISYTKQGYLIIGFYNAYLHKRYKLKRDDYVYYENNEKYHFPIRIVKTSSKSGKLEFSSSGYSFISYENLTENSVTIKYALRYKDNIIERKLMRTPSKCNLVEYNTLKE